MWVQLWDDFLFTFARRAILELYKGSVINRKLYRFTQMLLSSTQEEEEEELRFF